MKLVIYNDLRTFNGYVLLQFPLNGQNIFKVEMWEHT